MKEPQFPDTFKLLSKEDSHSSRSGGEDYNDKNKDKPKNSMSTSRTAKMKIKAKQTVSAILNYEMVSLKTDSTIGKAKYEIRMDIN